MFPDQVIAVPGQFRDAQAVEERGLALRRNLGRPIGLHEQDDSVVIRGDSFGELRVQSGEEIDVAVLSEWLSKDGCFRADRDLAVGISEDPEAETGVESQYRDSYHDDSQHDTDPPAARPSRLLSHISCHDTSHFLCRRQ